MALCSQLHDRQHALQRLLSLQTLVRAETLCASASASASASALRADVLRVTDLLVDDGNPSVLRTACVACVVSVLRVRYVCVTCVRLCACSVRVLRQQR